MTQAQLYQLYSDALELMIYDDITEVFAFLDYLAQKYDLEFDRYDASDANFNNKQYNPPKE